MDTRFKPKLKVIPSILSIVFYSVQRMSGYDPQLLSLMGIEETLYDFPLPLFARYQMTKYQEGILTMYH